MAYTLGLRRRSDGSPDAHGNAAETYGATEDWIVLGYFPGEMVEPNQPNRERSDIAWSVLAWDDGNLPDDRDRVVLDGEEYDVDGRPADYRHGPWGFPNEAALGGVVVKLKRMEG